MSEANRDRLLSAAVEAFAESLWAELADDFHATLAEPPAPAEERAPAVAEERAPASVSKPLGEAAFETPARSSRAPQAAERAPQAADGLHDRVHALVEVLNRQGFVTSLHPVRTGQQLCQYHCPVAHVAAEFPELCRAETKVFAQLLGSHVQRIATIAHADGVCTTHIPHPVDRKVSR